MKRTLSAGTLVAILIAAPAFAQSPTASDAEFIQKASVGSLFEIEEGKLAEQRATDPALKTFARNMVADHGDALKKLGDAAGKAGNKTADALDAPHQAMLDNLKSFNGPDFDKIYKADQVAAHAETVALLSDYKQSGKNGDLSSWTKDALPIVKHHRAAIDAM